MSIINEILEIGNYKHFIEMKSDFYLNHKIMKAFQIHEENKVKEETVISEMELIKLPRGDISLRIPDHLLIPHIQFNKYAEIV